MRVKLFEKLTVVGLIIIYLILLHMLLAMAASWGSGLKFGSYWDVICQGSKAPYSSWTRLTSEWFRSWRLVSWFQARSVTLASFLTVAWSWPTKLPLSVDPATVSCATYSPSHGHCQLKVPRQWSTLLSRANWTTVIRCWLRSVMVCSGDYSQSRMLLLVLLLAGTRRCEHITPVLRQLHWLLVYKHSNRHFGKHLKMPLFSVSFVTVWFLLAIYKCSNLRTYL